MRKLQEVLSNSDNRVEAAWFGGTVEEKIYRFITEL